MRKILMLVILIFLVLIGVMLPKRTFGAIVTTWEQLTADSAKLLERADEFEEKNTKEFEAKIEEVVAEYANMQDEKELYEDKIEQIKNNKVDFNLKTYNVQYLWMEIGKYAGEENVYLNMNVNQSQTSQSLSSSYQMCDLVFQGYGLYSELNSFVEKIEKNEDLGFYIDSFKLQPITKEELTVLKRESDYWNSFSSAEKTTILKLTFSALEIPINTDDLTKLSDELLAEYKGSN